MNDSYWDKDEQILEETEEKSPWWSSRPVLIIFLAIVSIVILSFLWHALLPSKPTGNVEVPYVKAETTPIKTRPENPGGADIPHKDKMVYNLISDSSKEEPQKEVLKPAPAKPLYDTKFENPLELSDKKEKVAVEAVTPAVPVKKIDVFKDKPVAHSVVQTKPEPKKASGKYRVQVGALSSKASAETHIKSLKKKHASLKPHAIEVIKATVNGKTIYRLHAGAFETKALALSACNKVKAGGGQCVVVTRS